MRRIIKDERLLGPKPKFDETPEWRRTVHQVLRLSERGQSEEQIINKLKLDTHVVRRILEDDEIKDKYAKTLFDKKVPTIQQIIGSSLSVINHVMVNLVNDEYYRDTMVKNLNDVKMLKDLVKDLNILLRLEFNQSTQNVAVSGGGQKYEQTRVAIQELKKIDQVFEYPDLPELPSSKIEGENGD